MFKKKIANLSAETLHLDIMLCSLGRLDSLKFSLEVVLAL